jgi:hypothetical protein
VVLTPRTVLASAAVIDEITGDDGSVVLLPGAHGDRVLRLSVMAARARALCSPSMSLGDLSGRLAQEYGEPPDGDRVAATIAIVEGLIEGGVLVVDSDPPAG